MSYKEVEIDNCNDKFKEMYENTARYLIVYGGAGSGKSYEISKYLLSKLLSNKEVNILVVRQTAKSNRNTTFAQIKQTIGRNNLHKYFRVNRSDLTITNIAFGNQIVFGGLDDVEKLKSTTFENGILTDIWMEEASETMYDDFLQLDLRLRGELKNTHFQMTLSFNPIKKKHWIYDRFFDKTDNRASIIKTTYKDNKFIDEETIKTIEYMRIHNPMYYQVYGLAEWGELEEGLTFKRQYYAEWEFIPHDAIGVVYCDPNLSKKGKGDTTAIVKLLYSQTTNQFYISDAKCDTYSDSNELLKDYLFMRDEKARWMGFDGHVSQESSWSQHVRNFCSIHGIPSPIIEYKRYRVDDLSKNAQVLWNEGRLLFPPNFQKTSAGEKFLQQLYVFAGKKNTKAKDDAPDALICATEFIVESGLATLQLQQRQLLQKLINKR
jgi:PBSX family phage terminase large subunit